MAYYSRGLSMRRFLLVLVCVSALAESTSPIYTAGMLNGRAWESFPEPAKTVYVAGIQDSVLGNLLAAEETPRPDDIPWANNFTVDDYVKELNVLYKDRENIRIPIVLAVRYITTKLRGARTKDNLDYGLKALREWVSELK